MSNSFQPNELYSLYSSGQNPGEGRLSFLQGIFPTQSLNPGLPHWRWIFYQLSHKESPRILEWVGSLFLLQQILKIQESNWGVLYCKQILYELSYEGRSFSKKYVFKKTQEKLTVYILNGFLYSYNFNALTLDIVDIYL